MQKLADTQISVIEKDALRQQYKKLRKMLDDKDKAYKASVGQQILDEAKTLLNTMEEKQPVVVHQFSSGGTTKSLDAALKTLAPKASARLVISCDEGAGKVLCMAAVDGEAAKQISAADWLAQVAPLINGEGLLKEFLKHSSDCRQEWWKGRACAGDRR